MRKYMLAVIAATSITLLLCLAGALTRPGLFGPSKEWVTEIHMVLQRPLALRYVIPAVCSMFVALTLSRKISLRVCGLMTLINISIYAGSIVFLTEGFFRVQSWFFNSQELIVIINPIWFSGIAVFGIQEKRPFIWILCIFGLAMMIFLQSIIAVAYSGTPTAYAWFKIVTGGSLVLIAALTVYDWLIARRSKTNKTEMPEEEISPESGI